MCDTKVFVQRTLKVLARLKLLMLLLSSKIREIKIDLFGEELPTLKWSLTRDNLFQRFFLSHRFDCFKLYTEVLNLSC